MLKKVLFTTGVTVLASLGIFSTAIYADGAGLSPGDSSAAELFTGSISSHYILLSSNGVVSAWGENTYGQCGAEPCDYVDSINYIDFESKVTKVSAGIGFSLALDESNFAWGWGNNAEYQLGISNQSDSCSEPVKISEGITDIAAGEDFSVLLNSDGEVLFSGMGSPDILKVLELPQTGAAKIKLIAAGYDNIVAVDETNMVYWLKTDTDFTNAAELPENVDIESAAVGRDHLVLKCSDSDNTYIYTCGDNSKYQLGVSDTEYSLTPVLSLTVPRDEHAYVNVFAGEYSVIADAWNNMSSRDSVTEYRWGTGCSNIRSTGNLDSTDVMPLPETVYKYNQLIAAGADNCMAFDYVEDTIMFNSSDSSSMTAIPLIETEDDLQPVFKYQYDNTEYQTYTVNFIKLNSDTFQEGNKIYDEYTEEYSDRYLLWELVDEHHFRVKIKDFISGVKLDRSIVSLSKEATGENRDIGTYGPSLWSFRAANISVTTDKQTIISGREDGTVIPITPLIFNAGVIKQLELRSDTPVFYEDPGTICEDTQLGLYIYGLPEGVSADVVWNDDGSIEIHLNGNSNGTLQEETQTKYSLINDLDSDEVSGKIGDYDLNNTRLNVASATINDFLICPQSCNITGIRLLSTEDKEIDTLPDNSEFIAEVSVSRIKEDIENAELLLAVYGVNGELLHTDLISTEFSENDNYSYSFRVPAQSEDIDGIKAFIWKDSSTMKSFGAAQELMRTHFVH